MPLAGRGATSRSVSYGDLQVIRAAEPLNGLQSLALDDFLYFFLRMRKQRVRMVVQAVKSRWPAESREAQAKRLISSHASLAMLAGALFHIPSLLPKASAWLKALGFVGGAAALTRMQLYQILEIALLYDKDIDDRSRVPEMMTVVAAAAAAVAAPKLLVKALDLHPLLSLPAAGLTAAALTHVLGSVAIQHYAELPVREPEPV